MNAARTMQSRAERGRAGRATQERGGRDRVPIDRGAAAVEDWLSDAGLPARVVERCPHPACSACGRRFPDAA